MLAAHAMTDAGAQAARGLMPRAAREEIAASLAATSEMRTLLSEGFRLDRVADPTPALARAKRQAVLGGEELRGIGLAIMAADAAIRATRGDSTPALARIGLHVRTLRELGTELTTVLGARGEVLDAASSELASLRRRSIAASDAARQRTIGLMRKTQIARALQESGVGMRDERFVLPIKIEFANQIPGIVHDTSASGQTVFLEPLEAVDANNRVRTLRHEEQAEVARILARLSALVTKEAALVEHLLAVLTELDLACARALLAQAMDAHPMQLTEDLELRLDNARHPLLGARAVAQSFELNAARRLLIISGPNMGGKTVALKMAGLALVMTGCGLHVPADPTSCIGRFTHVRADIGDAQSIAMNASTFSAHLGRLREILAVADDGLLFLVDEIASGTEPASGAALAVAVLDRLLASGASGIVTTHAQELKAYAQDRDVVENAGMRFAAGTHIPTYELDVGVPGRSLAFDLAAREGFDDALLEVARGRVDVREHAYDRALAELSEARADVSEERRAAREERLALHRERERLAEDERKLAVERQRFGERAEQELARSLRDFVGELRKRAGTGQAKVTRAQSELMAQTLEEMRSSLRLNPVRSAEPEPAAFRKGSLVRLRGLGSQGVVLEDQGASLVVSVGAMRMTVSKRECELLAKKAPKRRFEAPRSEHQATQEEQAVGRIGNVATEVDVRGKRFVEAQEIVGRWLDTALLAGYSPLRIIHGKGTGALGAGLQEMLRVHPSIRRVRFGNEDEGGGGITIIDV